MPECYGQVFNIGADKHYSVLELAEEVARLCNQLSGKATGANEKAAQANAAKELFKEITKLYGGTMLSDMITDEIKAYDAETKHGATQGAVLKTSIK